LLDLPKFKQLVASRVFEKSQKLAIQLIGETVNKARESDDADLLFDLIFMDMDSVELDALID
jgi:hypothetical protein